MQITYMSNNRFATPFAHIVHRILSKDFCNNNTRTNSVAILKKNEEKSRKIYVFLCCIAVFSVAQMKMPSYEITWVVMAVLFLVLLLQLLLLLCVWLFWYVAVVVSEQIDHLISYDFLARWCAINIVNHLRLCLFEKH